MISKKKNEDAVSPVIGVMLMLVVTVVIAAVVVTFSTGLAGSTGTTPTALFEVSGTDTYQGGLGEELAYVNIRHKGGDTIPLSDLPGMSRAPRSSARHRSKYPPPAESQGLDRATSHAEASPSSDGSCMAADSSSPHILQPPM